MLHERTHPAATRRRNPTDANNPTTDRRDDECKDPMKFDSHINKALQACPAERAALDAANTMAEAFHAERGKIEAALERLRNEPDGARLVRREIGGVIVEVQAGDRRDDIQALARRRDTLPELYRSASEARDNARRKLSRSVASKLADAEADLKERTLKILELATALAQDADALELAMQTAGLDSESLYCCRFEVLQSLRVDAHTDGQIIQSRLQAA